MRRILVSGMLVILCFVLQTTLFKGIAFSGIVPNLMIILTASFGFMRGEKEELIIVSLEGKPPVFFLDFSADFFRIFFLAASSA